METLVGSSDCHLESPHYSATEVRKDADEYIHDSRVNKPPRLTPHGVASGLERRSMAIGPIRQYLIKAVRHGEDP
jgi:hypothetical protein